MTAEEIVARLIYRDGLMLVIDKPAGLAVHRGPKGGESLEDYFDALRFGLPRPPALAHRLDRDTSGCLVLGRHRKALAALGRLFKNGRVGKSYWDPTGQPAVTTWKVMGRTQSIPGPSNSPDLSWLALEPLTGRTHQLRVHCAAMGWPIIGDSVYGGAPRTETPGLHLHAREVVVPLYNNRAPIRVTAPVPPHMRHLLHACGWLGQSVAE